MNSELFLGLGGNLGDVREHFKAALSALSTSSHFEVGLISSAYRTPALTQTGISHDVPNYWNIIAMVSSDLDVEQVLASVKELETSCGRTITRERWASRPLDIDLLAWGLKTLESEHLTLPHPRCLERDFVLAPWVEIRPDFVIPGGSNLTVQEHWSLLRSEQFRLSPILEVDKDWVGRP